MIIAQIQIFDRYPSYSEITEYPFQILLLNPAIRQIQIRQFSPRE